MAITRNSTKQKRQNPTQRGSENVSNDDTRRVAHQETTTRWDRVPNAIEYLRRYVEHLEVVGRDKANLNVTEAIRIMDSIYKLKEQIAEQVKSPLEKVYDSMRFAVVPELMIEADMTTTTIEGIGRCSIQDDISATVPKEFKDEFMSWLVEHELEDLISKTVNAATLAAFVRKQLQKKDGVKLPTNLIKITPVTRAAITRS